MARISIALTLLTLCAWLALAPLTAAAQAPEVGRRHALVVGNANYMGMKPLKNPVNDSAAICEALNGLRFQTQCLNDVTSLPELGNAVREFARRLQPSDVALFYFAGHGLEVEGQNYLIPTAARIESGPEVEAEALRLGFVFDLLRASGVRLSIIILDACRNNPYGGVRAIRGAGLAAPTRMPGGSVLFFPTAPGDVANDGRGANGLFTSHLLRHLKAPDITVEEMFKRVIDDVRVESRRDYPREQVPWMNLSFSGEFCFTGCSARVSSEQFKALLREKQQVERMVGDLQAQLVERQTEVAAFRLRMTELELRLGRQGADASLSQAQRDALEWERAEHARKSVRLKEQEVEIARLGEELRRFEQERARIRPQEAEVASAAQRLVEQQRDPQRMVLAQAERDELERQQARSAGLRQDLAEARGKLDRLQEALDVVQRQQRELDEYRLRVARLEAESQGKDRAIEAMRAGLESRERELEAVRSRLGLLQQQLDLGWRERDISQQVLAKLREERDQLVESSRQLAARDRELAAVRQELLRLEGLRSAMAAAERQLADTGSRTRSIEARLASPEAERIPPEELAELRRERDQLAASNEALRRTVASQQSARAELDDLRQRLARYDQQQVELASYRSRLADAEKRLQDAATATVKGAAFVAPAL
ncbi:MAG: caspase family protein [Ideonella sp.]|nr:caspase family protein [Ideonella sp.]